MMLRRSFLTKLLATAAASTVPGQVFAQSGVTGIVANPQNNQPGVSGGNRVRRLKKQPPAARQAPSAAQIKNTLQATPQRKIAREKRVHRRQIRNRQDFRQAAPSIDIQAINFEFGSSRIHPREYWKVREIGIAFRDLLNYNPSEVFLIEGHTDAVGSRYSNQLLSEQRATSLKRVLVQQFGLSPYALETAGFGEEDLLIPTPYEEWRNRRVTIRRITDFISG